MAEMYFNEGEKALSNNLYKVAITLFATAKAFYYADENADGINECNNNIKELANYLNINSHCLAELNTYPINIVDYFNQVNNERKKFIGLTCEVEDPIITEVLKKRY